MYGKLWLLLNPKNQPNHVSNNVFQTAVPYGCLSCLSYNGLVQLVCGELQETVGLSVNIIDWPHYSLVLQDQDTDIWNTILGINQLETQ